LVKLSELKSLGDWPKMRGSIESSLHSVLGKMPNGAQDLQVKVIDEIEGPGYVRRQIQYFVDEWARISAWVFVPEDARDCPAIVCCHSRSKMGKDEPAGYEGADPRLAFARHFAENGYVTIAPDCISVGERKFNRLDPYDTSTYNKENPKLSVLGKMISDYRRCIDALEEVTEVDMARIGAIGHGLGGCNALMLGAIDERIGAVVSSCGFTRFADDKQPERWLEHEGLSLLPKLKAAIAKGVYPFDWEHILALIAPSPTLLITPENEELLSSPSSCGKAVADAQRVFAKLGAKQAIENSVHPGVESLPIDQLDLADEWFDRWL
jgi:dienelactone hydrolase